ncbi:MAG: Stk1 family PASTA domain-containing Ser/Thr kinase [Candidatus Nanopelagicales bacterium]|nr:Stk1 family PASTA domain-containing Ser/Thr kinase [Candidatus Nanopelagicales bacterium]
MSDVRMLGDRYEIGEVIGRGGMAEVHEARDVRLGRRVAIKILRPDLARDPDFQIRFRREAQSAAALNHPNIVAVYDSGEDRLDGAEGAPQVVVPYIVMEYVDGMTLRQLLASGRRLLPERALEIASGVLSALDYAHRHGIVHRDIKPGNVMLTRSGDVKVMDFGIARALNEAGTSITSTSAVMGTAQYLSPEQARGEVVDARSDLYSTGVLLYELLTGRPPFTGESAVSIAYQHVSEMPTPPSQIDTGVSPEIDLIVLAALAKRTDERYQTASEFRADVERMIQGGPITMGVPTVMATEYTQMLAPVEASGAAAYARARQPQRRRRRGLFWGIAAVVVLGIVAAVLVVATQLIPGGGTARVTVPNLEGLTIDSAQQLLSASNLILGQQTAEISDRPEGRITAQQPASGESIEEGQAINVTVSSGKEKATVPSLVGLSSAQDARTALVDANLQLGPVTEQDSDQPAGYVLEQSIPEGAQVNAGSTVAITVASGSVTVPAVIGSTEAQGRSDIVQAGFEPQVIYQDTGADVAGTVLAQSPKGGSKLDRGSIVTITVGRLAAVEPTPTPTIAPVP